MRRVVEAHGGGVELRETPGGGATFVISLPWDAAVADPNGDVALRAATHTGAASG